MITKNSYDAIVAVVEKMALLVMNNDEVKKVRYIEVDSRKYRVTFWWNFNLNESVVKVAEKTIYGYEELLVWNSTESEKTFPDFLMDIMNRGREIYNSSIIMRKEMLKR